MAIKGTTAKKLTKKEQAHLTEMGICSVGQLRRQIRYQKLQEHPERACHTCWTIARKLGIID